jgi:hypothetical protein
MMMRGTPRARAHRSNARFAVPMASGAAAPAWSATPAPHDASTRAGFHVGYAIKEGEFGKGLYATHFIPAGTLMWKYQSGARGGANVNVWSYASEAECRARLAEATAEEAAYIMDHVYMFDGRLNEITDDGKLWNHSEAPNTGLPPKGEGYCFESTYSIKDIQPGEQFLVRWGRAAVALRGERGGGRGGGGKGGSRGRAAAGMQARW